MRDDESQAGELYLVRLSGPHVGVVSIGEVEASATLDLSASAYYARLASVGGEVGPVELLCVVPPDPDRPSERVDAILGGWAEICGLPNSTLWVRDRVGEALEARWATLPTLAPPVAEDARVVGETR